MDAAEVLATVGFDNDVGVRRGWLSSIPREKFLPVAPEGDFDQLRHRL
jgi:hypothetical protein